MKKFFKLLLISLGLICYVSAHGTCNQNVIKNKPNTIYKDNNEITTDLKTGLMWQKCVYGQMYNSGNCTGTPTLFTWKTAFESVQMANTNNMYGYSDWRLPNIKELISLVEVACANPAINAFIFPNTNSEGYYWSSTTYIENNADALVVDAYSGFIGNGNKDYANSNVRLVRN